jgi:phosphoglycolate phosphatase
MNYKLIFFDFDGTLVDTLPDIAASTNFMLNKMGYPSIDSEIVKKNVGNGARILVKNCISIYNENLSEKELNEGLDFYLKYYKEHFIDKTRLYEGVLDTLKKLKTINFIYTNKPFAITEKIVNTLKIGEYFKKIIAPETYNLRKPDPKPVFIIRDEYKIDLNQMLLVGDSKYDIQAAENAGISACIVSYGYAEADEIEGSPIIIDKFQDLLKIL